MAEEPPELSNLFSLQAGERAQDDKTHSTPEQSANQLTLSKEDTHYETLAPAGSYSQDIQVGDVKLLIFELFPDESRHDDYVAHISRLSAEEMAQKLGSEAARPQIFVRDLTWEDLGSDFKFRRPLSITDFHQHYDLFEQADIINYSAGLSPTHWSLLAEKGEYNPKLHMEEAPEYYKKVLTGPIIVQAIGNHGYEGDAFDTDQGFDLATPDNIHFYPDLVTVGEVTRGSDGAVTLDEHSAACGPTLVSINRSDTGAKFKYLKDEELADAAKYGITTHEEGFVSGVQGTSFTAPDISGALASAKSVYPDFSNEELIATLCASCDQTELSQKSCITTAAGLSYNSFGWGYGVFNPDTFVDNLKLMAQTKAEIGIALPDTKAAIDNDFNHETLTTNGEDLNIHKFEIESDFTATRLTFFGLFTEQKVGAPDSVTIVSPSGTQHEVPVEYTADCGSLRVTTDAFMGESTKGAWSIITSGEHCLWKEGMEQDWNEISFKHASKRSSSFRLHGQEKDENGHSNIGNFLEKVENGAVPQITPDLAKDKTPAPEGGQEQSPPEAPETKPLQKPHVGIGATGDF